MSGRATIIRGDARALPLPDASVDLVVTSPPYFALRSYTDGGEHYAGQIGSEPTPADYIAALLDVTRECVRVLKPGGSIWVDLGDKYATRYSSVRGGGRAGLNSDDDSRGRSGQNQTGISEKSLILLPERYRIAAVDQLGLIARAVVIWSKPNGLPESVTDRVRRSHEDWVHLTKAPRYFSAVDEIREGYAPGTAKRYTTGYKQDPSDRARIGKGYDDSDGGPTKTNPLGKLPGSVWDIATQPLIVPPELKVDHFAAFPMEWPRRIILGWSPVGGVVLDPFVGTGTTALVASVLGRHGIAVDLSADYCRLARWRVNDPKQIERASRPAKPRPPKEQPTEDLVPDAMTWGRIHVGDTVRGADGRVWVVCERVAGPSWVLAGETARFVLRLGDRAVAVTRRADEPVAVVEVANHRAEAVAYGALTDAGLVVEVLEETTVSDTTEDLQGVADHPSGVPTAAELGAYAGVLDVVKPAGLGDRPLTPAERPDVATLPSAPAQRNAEPRRDRWGRYLLPDPITDKERAWTRVSTVARTLADEYHLARWGERMVAKGLALRPDLIAGAAAADVDADKGTLDSIAKQAKERAGSTAGANMGTAFHTFAQRLDGGEPLAALGAPAPLDADLTAYVDMLTAAKLIVVPAYMERIVVLPELGIAGTLDRLMAHRTGKDLPLSVLDLKSGKTVDFGWLEYAIQQALYARAAFMWDAATGAYHTMPPVNQDRALIAHVPIGKAKAQLYGVNIIEGWRLAQVAIQVREARTAASKGLLSWLVEPDDKAALALHNVSRAASRDELAALWDRLHPAGLWTDEVNAAAASRWESITTGVTQ